MWGGALCSMEIYTQKKNSGLWSQSQVLKTPPQCFDHSFSSLEYTASTVIIVTGTLNAAISVVISLTSPECTPHCCKHSLKSSKQRQNFDHSLMFPKHTFQCCDNGLRSPGHTPLSAVSAVSSHMNATLSALIRVTGLLNATFSVVISLHYPEYNPWHAVIAVSASLNETLDSVISLRYSEHNLQSCDHCLISPEHTSVLWSPI